MKAESLSSGVLKENAQQVLSWLLHHPLQRIRDVAIGLDMTESTTARILQGLGKQQLVEQVTPSLSVSNRHSWYYLSSAGISILAQQEGTDPFSLARAWQTDERHLLRMLPQLPRLIHLQDIVYSLVSCAPVALSDAGRQAEIRWGWQREYRVHFERRQRVMRCDADAVVVLRRRISTPPSSLLQPFFTIFVYLDLGRMCAMTTHFTMVRKLRNLLLYRESRERQPYRPMFPLVMIIVESARQLELWQQAAIEAARQLHLGKPLAGVIVNMAAGQTQREQLGSLWHYNWRHLTTNVHCHLQEMLVPMTASAIPPGIITNRVKAPDKATRSSIRVPIEGHYQERMKILLNQPDVGLLRASGQEREIVALLSLQMSDRYREILLILYTYPMLAIEELAAFCGLHPPTAYRYVLSLSATFGCLDCFRRPQGRDENSTRLGRQKEDVRWVLSVRGLRYLAASTAISPKQLYQKAPGRKPEKAEEKTRIWQRGIGQLYREWKHTAGVYQCVVAFHRAVQSQPDHRIAWFETHFRCARRYQVNKKWHNFRPDAVLEYVVKYREHTRQFHLWIEWDGGTMGSLALREKWHTYEIYMRSLEWRSYTSRGVLPLLLIIVPDRSQQDRVTRLVQEVFSNTTSLYVRITTQNLLYEHGPLATIWTEVVPRPPIRHLRALLDFQRTNEKSLASQ